MALPVTGTVTAKWTDWQGRAGGEPIRLIPTAELAYHAPTDHAFYQATIPLAPDAAGLASATVLATNSADITPVGWGYEVVFPKTWGVPSKVIQVPAGATVDLFAAAGIIPEDDILVGTVLSVNGVTPDVNGNVTLDIEAGDFVTSEELTAALADKVTSTALEAALTDVEADLTGLTAQVASAASAAATAQATADAAGDLAEQTAADLQQLVTEVPARTILRQAYINDNSGASIPDSGGAFQPVAGFSLSVPAVAGDFVKLAVRAMRSGSPSTLFLDTAIISEGAARWFSSTGTATPSVEGDPSFYPDGGFPRWSGSIGVLVTEDMVEDGNVVFRLMAKSQGSGRVYATPDYPFYWRAENVGPVD